MVQGREKLVEISGGLSPLMRDKTTHEWGTRIAEALGGAALGELVARDVHRHGFLEAVEDFVGGVLQTGVRFVQLASGFGGELAQLITVVDVGHCSKNQV
jgi:hypothetical protein